MALNIGSMSINDELLNLNSRRHSVSAALYVCVSLAKEIGEFLVLRSMHAHFPLYLQNACADPLQNRHKAFGLHWKYAQLHE